MRVMLRWFLMVGMVFACAPPLRAEFKTDAVVKIFVNANQMDYLNPWQSHGGEEGTGSGVIIAGQRILTNAHVVNDSTFIQVRRESNPKKYAASVEAIGKDCDLAILHVEDPNFFNGVEPLDFGGLPNLRESVTALGYPLGGDKLSMTQGVISRVEIIPYAQSRRPLLGVQIDAAINPGNSGGPVLQEGKVVGVVMQMIMAGQNIGYMIPVPIIRHFLADLEDGSYDGFPLLGTLYHNTENQSLRDYYRIPEEVGGVVVTHVTPFSAAEGALREEDVILELDGVAVASDGTVPFQDNERLAMSYVITAKQVGEDLAVKFLRKGRLATVKVTMKPLPDIVPIANYYKKPSYYIFGGLVFTILSTDMMNEWQGAFGMDWRGMTPISFLYWAQGNGQLNEKRKRELVVLSEVLPDAINVGYHEHRSEIITAVNGKGFDSFKDFVMLVESTPEGYVVFESEAKQKLILSTEEAARALADILKRNNIPSQCSEDVRPWLKHPLPPLAAAEP